VEKEKADHEEDLQFHLQVLEELRGFEEEYLDEEQSSGSISIEIIDEKREREQKLAVVIETAITDSERSPQKLTRAQYQDQKDKARACNLDREREKREKKKPAS
jgi:hypothetical protein